MAKNPSDADEPNVSHFLFRTPPQFPLTAEGQLARVFKQEYLDNERLRRLDEANERAAEVVKKLTEAAAVASAAAEQLALVAQSAAPPPPPPPPPVDDPGYRSVLHPNDWRSYAGFRASLMEAEAAVRKEWHLKPTETVRKWQVAGAAGVSVKQLARIEEHFHLDVKKHWPPSTWPEQEPKSGKFKQTTLLFTHAAAAVLVMAGCLGKIDPVRWLGT